MCVTNFCRLLAHINSLNPHNDGTKIGISWNSVCIWENQGMWRLEPLGQRPQLWVAGLSSSLGSLFTVLLLCCSIFSIDLKACVLGALSKI